MAYRFTQTADELQDIMDLAQSHIATPHSIETSYSKDDYCTYEGALYKALEDVSGAWDASKWEEVTVGEELANLGSVSSAGVELTQAEYDALPTKDPDTIYFIKDASNGHSKADASDVAYGDGTVKDALDVLEVETTTVTLGSTGQTATIIKYGKVVCITAPYDIYSLPTGETTAFTLDSKFRPIANIWTRPANVGGNDYRVLILPNGSIKLSNYSGSAITSAHNFAWSVCYIVS